MSNLNKVDRRIQRTEHLLMDALVALTLEKGYEAISIRDITERADVSYSTFFRHHTEKDDLLAEVLKSVIHDFKALIYNSGSRSKEEDGKLIFQHVADHQAFFRVLFSSQGASSVMHDIREEIALEILKSDLISASGMIPPEILANHITSSILALIRWWLDHDLPYSVERMGAIYSRLVIQGSIQAALAP